MINNDVPPKNWAKPCLIPAMAAKAGRMATIPKKMAPGNVMRDNSSSMWLAVLLPGFTPGMKPPLRFMSSASWLGFTVMAV